MDNSSDKLVWLNTKDRDMARKGKPRESNRIPLNSNTMSYEPKILKQNLIICNRKARVGYVETEIKQLIP